MSHRQRCLSLLCRGYQFLLLPFAVVSSLPVPGTAQVRFEQPPSDIPRTVVSLRRLWATLAARSIYGFGWTALAANQ